MSARLAQASAALDIQTGGGEALAGAAKFPPTMAATESWPPNIARAIRLLHPRGAVVAAAQYEPPLPFADEAFDLVTSCHPATIWWNEIARVLRAGGIYFAQHAGRFCLRAGPKAAPPIPLCSPPRTTPQENDHDDPYHH
jgi:SAM-dependent methyltransferase